MFHGCWCWPRLLNNLPAGVRQTGIGYKQFKRLLKIYLLLGIEIVMHCDYLFKLHL